MAYLFTVGRRAILLPHRMLGSVEPVLRELAQVLDALGAHLEDERWTEAAAALWGALAVLRKPSPRYEANLQLEREAVAVPDEPAASSTIRLVPPRKGQLSIAALERRRRR